MKGGFSIPAMECVWENDEDSIWVLVEASFSDKPMFTCVEDHNLVGGVKPGKNRKAIGDHHPKIWLTLNTCLKPSLG